MVRCPRETIRSTRIGRHETSDMHLTDIAEIAVDCQSRHVTGATDVVTLPYNGDLCLSLPRNRCTVASSCRYIACSEHART
jgi:hypothetical protein